MTAMELLPRLDGVRKTAKGWAARCPSHKDRRPSLSIHEGERGLLVRCWAGCETASVCDALGLTLADLFFDEARARDRRGVPAPRSMTPREFLSACEYGLWRGALAHELRGLAVLDSAKGFDTSGWSDDVFTRAMVAVCRGYDDLAVADHLHGLAFGLRDHLLREWRHAQRYRAA